MIRRLCCRLGFHRNRDLWRGPFDGVRQDVLWKCLDCEREEKITLICFLTGPRTGPMHPEAAAREAKRAKPRPLVPFKGWDQYYDGSADIGQIAATFRDLNDRLSKLEGKE